MLAILIAIVLWSSSGALAALIATDKGYNRRLWIGVGVLLGPFALVLALLRRPKGGSIEQQAAASGLLISCPACLREMWAKAPKCPHCREAVAKSARSGSY